MKNVFYDMKKRNRKKKNIVKMKVLINKPENVENYHSCESIDLFFIRLKDELKTKK